MKKVGIIQSSYIPWKGYFDLIRSVDLFIFHDDLQYTKQDWRNRNRIKTENGVSWLTIPCGKNEKRLICDVELKDPSWQRKHWNIIKANYRKAPFFKVYQEFFEDLYLGRQWKNLSKLNQYTIKSLCREFLAIKTTFDDSRKYNLQHKKNSRLLELLANFDTKEYISGPGARDYIIEETFDEANIKLTWMDYSGYPEYKQLHGDFESRVSIVDLLFNCGPDSLQYMKRL